MGTLSCELSSYDSEGDDISPLSAASFESSYSSVESLLTHRGSSNACLASLHGISDVDNTTGVRNREQLKGSSPQDSRSFGTDVETHLHTRWLMPAGLSGPKGSSTFIEPDARLPFSLSGTEIQAINEVGCDISSSRLAVPTFVGPEIPDNFKSVMRHLTSQVAVLEAKAAENAVLIAVQSRLLRAAKEDENRAVKEATNALEQELMKLDYTVNTLRLQISELEQEKQEMIELIASQTAALNQVGLHIGIDSKASIQCVETNDADKNHGTVNFRESRLAAASKEWQKDQCTLCKAHRAILIRHEHIFADISIWTQRILCDVSNACAELSSERSWLQSQNEKERHDKSILGEQEQKWKIEAEQIQRITETEVGRLKKEISRLMEEVRQERQRSAAALQELDQALIGKRTAEEELQRLEAQVREESNQSSKLSRELNEMSELKRNAVEELRKVQEHASCEQQRAAEILQELDQALMSERETKHEQSLSLEQCMQKLRSASVLARHLIETFPLLNDFGTFQDDLRASLERERSLESSLASARLHLQREQETCRVLRAQVQTMESAKSEQSDLRRMVDHLQSQVVWQNGRVGGMVQELRNMAEDVAALRADSIRDKHSLSSSLSQASAATHSIRQKEDILIESRMLSEQLVEDLKEIDESFLLFDKIVAEVESIVIPKQSEACDKEPQADSLPVRAELDLLRQEMECQQERSAEVLKDFEVALISQREESRRHQLLLHKNQSILCTCSLFAEQLVRDLGALQQHISSFAQQSYEIDPKCRKEMETERSEDEGNNLNNALALDPLVMQLDRIVFNLESLLIKGLKEADLKLNARQHPASSGTVLDRLHRKSLTAPMPSEGARVQSFEDDGGACICKKLSFACSITVGWREERTEHAGGRFAMESVLESRLCEALGLPRDCLLAMPPLDRGAGLIDLVISPPTDPADPRSAADLYEAMAQEVERSCAAGTAWLGSGGEGVQSIAAHGHISRQAGRVWHAAILATDSRYRRLQDKLRLRRQANTHTLSGAKKPVAQALHAPEPKGSEQSGPHSVGDRIKDPVGTDLSGEIGAVAEGKTYTLAASLVMEIHRAKEALRAYESTLQNESLHLEEGAVNWSAESMGEVSRRILRGKDESRIAGAAPEYGLGGQEVLFGGREPLDAAKATVKPNEHIALSEVGLQGEEARHLPDGATLAQESRDGTKLTTGASRILPLDQASQARVHGPQGSSPAWSARLSHAAPPRQAESHTSKQGRWERREHEAAPGHPGASGGNRSSGSTCEQVTQTPPLVVKHGQVGEVQEGVGGEEGDAQVAWQERERAIRGCKAKGRAMLEAHQQVLALLGDKEREVKDLRRALGRSDQTVALLEQQLVHLLTRAAPPHPSPRAPAPRSSNRLQPR